MRATRRRLVLITVCGALALGAITGLACSDDDDDNGSTQQGAEAALCSDLDALEASIQRVRNLSTSSTLDEAEQAKEGVEEALADVRDSARDVGNARIDELDAAKEDLDDAIRSISNGQTISEAATSIQAEARGVGVALSNLASSVSCP